MPRWYETPEPRLPNGRFKPKFSQSVRVSSRSISYNGGVRVPLVPGRAQLYVGGLLRVERTVGNRAPFFQRQINSGIDAVANRLGDQGGNSNLAQLLKGNDIQTGQFRVQGTPFSRNPTFRISSTPATRENAAREAANERAPRRRPRTRSAVPSVASTVTAGARTPPRVRKPRQARAGATQGRQIKR